MLQINFKNSINLNQLKIQKQSSLNTNSYKPEELNFLLLSQLRNKGSFSLV